MSMQAPKMKLVNGHPLDLKFLVIWKIGPKHGLSPKHGYPKHPPTHPKKNCALFVKKKPKPSQEVQRQKKAFASDIKSIPDL